MNTLQLAQFSRQLGTSLDAGIDIRRSLASQADRARGRTGAALQRGADAVAAGETLAATVAAEEATFPPLFRAVVQAGERSGRLGEVLLRLADHYDGQVRLRRRFLARVRWPLIQLTAAACVVGFLIWVLGVIEGPGGPRTDVLGWGLFGTRGLLIYVAAVGTVAAIGVIVFRLARRAWRRSPWMGRIVHRIPGWGGALKNLSLSRLAWTLSLTLESGMSVRDAVSLAMDAARDPRLDARRASILAAIGGGNSLHQALTAAEAFPPGFVGAVQVGEESGRLVESLAHVSRQHEEQAQSAIAGLTTLSAFGVWALVAAIMIWLIFRLFSFYAGTIDRALQL